MKSLYNLLTTKGQLFALVLGVVVIAISLISIMGGLGSAGYEVGTDLNSIMKSGGGDGFNFFNAPIALATVLIVLGFILWIGFTLIQLISNPKDSMKMIIAFGITILLFFIFMSISDAESTGRIASLSDRFNVSDGVSKFISGGIKTTLVLSIGAFIAMVVMEILNLFK